MAAIRQEVGPLRRPSIVPQLPVQESPPQIAFLSARSGSARSDCAAREPGRRRRPLDVESATA